MKSRSVRPMLVTLSTAVLSCSVVSALGAGGTRVFERELPASDLSRVSVIAGNGEITVIATPEEVVRVRLEARAKRWTGDDDRGPLAWFLSRRLEDEPDLLQAISLSERVEDGELVLRAHPRGRSRESRIAETWRLEVPARLALELSASSAEVEVSGVAGGVRLRQGHGAAIVTVPGGDLDLGVQVGRLEARSGAREWRRVGLRSDVGSTRLLLDGRRMRYPNPPGPGSHVTLEGRGEDTLELRVQVGDAVLRLE